MATSSSEPIELVTVCERKLQELIDNTAPEAQQQFKKEMDGFFTLWGSYIQNYASRKAPSLDWEKIHPPPSEMIIHYHSLISGTSIKRSGSFSDLRKSAMDSLGVKNYGSATFAEIKVPEELRTGIANKFCVLKLNGGLGTTMGCRGPKSVIEVREDQTFLDLTVTQLLHFNSNNSCKVPLILMNSFSTHTATSKVIHKYSDTGLAIHTFEQSRYPRIFRDSKLPVARPSDTDEESWYPPGHGDVFQAFYNSGLLDQMLDEGKEYVFVSNIDNLGATLDAGIMAYLAKSNCEYLMEVTNKTRSDLKGGTLIEYEGKIRLLEVAQVPPNKLGEFTSIKKFTIFNTNNLWISLKAIKRFVENKTFKEMDIIVNPKKTQHGDIIQLETAAGAAIRFFENAKGVNVPRSRFLPVKSTSDLLITQSNLYELQNGVLILNKKRIGKLPYIKLGDHLQKVPAYNARIPSLPDILELDQLTVSGDVTFGSNVTLKGTVIVIANSGAHIDIPSGSVLHNNIVTGDFRVLDH